MTKKLREKIFERDNYTCQWCGKNDIDENMLLPAHIRTACLCGDDRESNLITFCRYCYNHVPNKEIMRKFETVENKREFNELYQQRVAGYGDYVNYVKSVFSSNGLTGTRPQIDRFVKNYLPTEDDLNGFKAEVEKNPKRARHIMQKCFIRKITYTEYKRNENNENSKDNKNCNLTTCRYNKSGTCMNEDKRKECVEVSKKVLCLEDRENE